MSRGMAYEIQQNTMPMLAFLFKLPTGMLTFQSGKVCRER